MILVSTVAYGSGRSLSLAVPRGAGRGDLVIAATLVDGDRTRSLTSTEALASHGISTAPGGDTFGCWSGVLDEEEALGWTWGDVSTGRAGVLLGIPGYEVVEVRSAEVGGAGTDRLTTPSVTVPPGGIALQVVTNYYETRLTPPEDWDPVVEQGSELYVAIYSAEREGATGEITTVTDGGSMPYVGWSIALGPLEGPEPTGGATLRRWTGSEWETYRLHATDDRGALVPLASLGVVGGG